jgi:APA family basic amino acid/polyamine antiporter
VFADWIFFALAGVALIVFRFRRPDAPRPYRAPLYPVLPLVFTLAGFGIVANMFIADQRNAVIGSAIIGLGVPVFFAWRWWSARTSSRP